MAQTKLKLISVNILIFHHRGTKNTENTIQNMYLEDDGVSVVNLFYYLC